MHTKSQLTEHLKKLGLRSGDLIMLHASVKAIGKVLGGPDQIHQAILDCVAPTGTLMMYVGCPPELEILTNEERLIVDGHLEFDPTLTRSNPDYGSLAELFRSWPGTICSTNPVCRMAALGAKAQWLLADHPVNYGYGSGSPLAKLYENQGKILLLGSNLARVTILHYAEDIAPIAHKRVIPYQVPVKKDKQCVWVQIEEYDSDNGICPWPPGFFATVVQQYLQKYAISSHKVGDADSYLLDAKTLVDFAVLAFCEEAEKIRQHLQ